MYAIQNKFIGGMYKPLMGDMVDFWAKKALMWEIGDYHGWVFELKMAVMWEVSSH